MKDVRAGENQTRRMKKDIIIQLDPVNLKSQGERKMVRFNGGSN